MRQTKEILVNASSLPLSVIIVGVGRADFSMMEELDADKKMLQDESGRKAVRDIVQFVPFRDLQGNAYELSKQVLAEVPKQVTQFMYSAGQQPMQKQVIARQDIVI